VRGGRPARTLAAAVAALVLIGFGAGFAAAFPVAIATLLWAAWRYDNAAGALLPLAVLFVPALVILMTLVAFLVVVARA